MRAMVLVVVLCGCSAQGVGTNTVLPDMSMGQSNTQPDMLMPATGDMAKQAVAPDMTQTDTDMAQGQANQPDMLMAAADMTTPADMTTAPDMTKLPDMTQPPPDLTPTVYQHNDTFCGSFNGLTAGWQNGNPTVSANASDALAACNACASRAGTSCTLASVVLPDGGNAYYFQYGTDYLYFDYNGTNAGKGYLVNINYVPGCTPPTKPSCYVYTYSLQSSWTN